MGVLSPSPLTGDLIEDDILERFFAPVEFDLISQFVAQHNAALAKIHELHGFINGSPSAAALDYFFRGNSGDKYGHSSSLRHSVSFQEIFQLDGAINQLTADSWSGLLKSTDLMNEMPQTRRNEWNEVLHAWREHGYKKGAKPEIDMPEFTADNARATISGLMARRSSFLAERVDGIFRNLSRSHVTNQPQGFYKRMILNNIYTDFGGVDHEREGFIHDLRIVISKFMGRDEPCRESTNWLLRTARASRGEWIEADAGALRVRGYLKGTAHLEVHPEMAWRLNCILSHLYPAAIPEGSRTRPQKKDRKAFSGRDLIDRPIPGAVCNFLIGMETFYTLEKSSSYRRDYDRKEVRNSLARAYSSRTKDASKYVVAEAEQILTALGGVKVVTGPNRNIEYFQFDYYPNTLVREVALRGFLPDDRAYQFYPTPETVGQAAVSELDLADSDMVLEPSAGDGALADLLPQKQVHCVEITETRSEILRAKGYAVEQADFLLWKPMKQFNKVLMNPPFSEGRWQAHLRHASGMLDVGGTLVAILPEGARKSISDLLPAFTVSVKHTFQNAFSGTGVSVIVVKAIKKDVAQ